MQPILRIASILVTAYSFLIVARVLLSLFVGEHSGPAWRVLSAATAPVLRLFHGLRFLRTASVDFTPIAAVVTLQVLASLLWSFSVASYISAVTVVAALLFAVWRILFWIIGFFTLAAVIRFAALFLSRRPASPFFRILDNILAPAVGFASRFFPQRRHSDYRVVLGAVAFLLLLLCIVGLFIVEPSLHLLCSRSGFRTW